MQQLPKEISEIKKSRLKAWHNPIVTAYLKQNITMKIEVLADAEAVAREAAALIAAEARAAVAERGRFVVAVSGGHTPWVMLRALAEERVPWDGVHLVQVDERVAPAGHPDRNLTHLHESLLEHAPLRADQIYAMPVELPDLEAAARQYAGTLAKIAGSPPVNDVDVAVTGTYQGRRRITLTYPIINRSRHILWLVTGHEKAGMLVRLRDADASIPGGRVSQAKAFVLADSGAAERRSQ